MTDKELYSIAAAIHKEILSLRKNRYQEQLRQLSLFVSHLQEVAYESKRFGLAVSRNWYAAADRCTASVLRSLYAIPHSMSHIESILERKPPRVLGPSILFEELKGAQEEFGGIAYDSEENLLSVVTEPITLENIDLGPFKIALYPAKLQEMYQRTPYYISAVEPNPACKDETITHPHVSGEILCEGDGAGAIRAALEEGRLCDFFCMVRSVLQTYNPDSPYVALSEWDGTCCSDCGYVMDSEDVGYCNDPVCDSCSRVCTECGEIICGNCASRCEICDKPLCPNCAKTKCTECKAVCCKSCLMNGLCPSCEEEMENQEDEETNENEPQTTDVPKETTV